MIETNSSRHSILYIGGDSRVIKEINENKRLILYQVDNGLEAVDYIQKNNTLDGIICEMWLPGSTGLEFFKFFSNSHLSHSNIIYPLLALFVRINDN